MRGGRFLLVAFAAFLPVCFFGCASVLEGEAAQGLMMSVARTQDNFMADQKIAVYAEPDDLDVYRELLPGQFDMPEHPMLVFVLVDFMEVGPWPLTRYQEGNISLRASYQGEEGWHTIFLPVNKWVAMWAGRTMGYPKYIADEITLEPEGEGWRGEVISDGTSRLLLEFSPGEVKVAPVWEREEWDLGGPSFNLRPPGKGPDVEVVRWSEGVEPEIELTPGYVRVTIGSAEPGAGLLTPGKVLPGVFVVKKSGGGSLTPE